MSSTYSDSDTSSLLTISDSIRQSLYRIHGGRRLQAVNEDYGWPCDSAAAEMELNVNAVCASLHENGLYWEPRNGVVEEMLSSTADEEHGPARILDLGCGVTASWAIGMAERFVDVEVIGVDLVPADLSFAPPNLSIEVHDLLEGLPYPDGYFSFVHARLTFATAFFDPEYRMLSEIARVLRPGGMLNFEEPEDMRHPFFSTYPDNPHLDPALARNHLRIERYPPSQKLALHRMDWGARMADEIRQAEGFRIIDGGRVEEVELAIPLGYTEGHGPAHTQVGARWREFHLDTWEMVSFALGMSEDTIIQARLVDELVLPAKNVGLYAKSRKVLATKGEWS